MSKLLKLFNSISKNNATSIEKNSDKPVAREWDAGYSLIMWGLGLITLLSLSYLQIINEWLGRIITELVIAVIPILFVYSIFKGNIRHLGFVKPTSRDIGIAILGGLGGITVGFLSFQLEVLIIGSLPPGYVEFQAKFIPQNIIELLGWIAFSMIIVGPCEEIFSRGFIQKGFEKTNGVIPGLIISSILFGVLHIDIFRMFPTAMEGLVLGLVYVYTKRKSSVSALSHGLLNSIIFVLTFLFPYYYGL